jgi:O-methyltransferase involved in polyketide biosynthesis
VCDLDHENRLTMGTSKETNQPSGKGSAQLNQAEQAMHAGGTVAAASGPGDPSRGGPQPATASSSRWQRLDSGLSNVARIYDALLGGKDNYAADREAARRLVEAVPDAQRAARDNRAFLGRAVRFLAAEAGIAQFLDIGTGLPTRGNVHEIARQANPDARVVYCDNDPVVMAHARALLADTADVEAVEGDVRYPRHLLTLPAVRELIDFSRPVAVLLVAVLHFVPDGDSPWSAVKCITDHLAPGSYLVISHVTGDQIPDDAVRQAREIYSGALAQGAARSRGDIARFFDGVDLIEPGLVDVATWRSGRRRTGPGRPVLFYAGVGCKQGGPT